MAIDASGNVWVANYGSSNVTELSSAGALLGTLSVGTGPHGMAIDASGKAINYSGGAWHTPVLVDPGSTDHADLGLGELDAVSCPTTTYCMAVSNLDGYGIYNGAS